MTMQELETVYERLAVAIDTVGAEAAPLFLAKLALLMAREMADGELVLALIEAACADLPRGDQSD